MFDPEDEITLTELAGLEMEWAADGTLTFPENVAVEEVQSRPLDRLRTVAFDPLACTPPDRIQYWMYNGVVRRRDRERLARTGMRYGLTLLLPNAIGRERAKTLGHLHTRPASSLLDYPEIYEVLYGTAWFVFQTLEADSRSSALCAVVEAHPGDKVIIPPNLHHLTINAGNEPLLVANVIPVAVRAMHQPLVDMRGAAWFNTVDQDWIKNPHYRSVAELQHWPVTDIPDLGLTRARTLYQIFVQSPELLVWMLEPMSFPDVFPDAWDRLGNMIRGA